MNQAIDRLWATLDRQGLRQAILSQPETVAHLVGYSDPVEDWPVANPFIAGPALVVLKPSEAFLVVPDCYAAHVQGCSIPVVTYRSYDYQRPPDPYAELERVLDLSAARTGVETGSLPVRIADALRTKGLVLVGVDELVIQARRRKLPVEIEAIKRASHLADVVQQAVKNQARPGLTEAELAGLAQAAMYRAAGKRVPAVLWVTAGEATSTGGAEPTGRVIAQGDLVLTDTSPWIEGSWSDTANAVVVGKPTADHRRVFDALRRALDMAIDLCRPGTPACEIDRQVRASLSQWGSSYPHHTGHGIGAAWSEEPRIVPYNEMRIEEDMVLAVEPAIYRPGWGGMRLEHVFVVRRSGNEVLTQFEHTL